MATTPEFKYAPMFQLGKDNTEYRLLTTDGVSTGEFEGKTILKVTKEALTLLAQQAFHDVEFMLRREHNLQVAKILSDPEASENDKYVALQFLRNAETAAKGILPFCQDTGTAIIHGEKGQRVWTDFEDEEALSRGVYNTFTEDNLRYSQNAPLNMYDEVNTRCNLPAQIDIEATEGDEYRFVMVAKGGGSANKTYFYPMTKATIQNEGTLLPFLVEKMKTLGTAACPPYHIAFVIGGTSAEKNLLTVKLASIKYYDNLPTTGDETGRAFRDIDLENKLLEEAYKIGLGAQFGGKYLAHDIRVIRLPRHGASCPIGMGVSCSADRNIKAKINKDGIWLEKMDSNPSELIPEELRKPGEGAKGIEINLGLDNDIFCFNVESVPELEIINELAEAKGKIARVAFRINPDVGAHTHTNITTGLAENKFGISMRDMDHVIDLALNMKNVKFVGLHFHIGSQILDMGDFIALCNRINELQEKLYARQIIVEHINVGGGLGIDYAHPNRCPIPDFAEYFATYHKHLRLRPQQTLHFELGRAVVGQCGSLITKVIYVKQGTNKQFAIVDAGMTDLIRPALYQAYHKIENITSEEERETYDVVGPICESSDVFGKAIDLNRVKRGDLFALRSAGAYGEIMASSYNCRPLPKGYTSDELL